MLDIQHLTKTYGEKKAVDDLSLHIAPGEIYGFIGHNGAGKTTTLKSVVGILQFDPGEITIDGRSIKADPLGCKREMAYIPDNPDLYDFMSGIKYLNFIADIFGVSADDRQTRIRDYAARFELTEDLEVNDAAVPLILNLIDEVSGLRRRMRAVDSALGEMPELRARLIARLDASAPAEG